MVKNHTWSKMLARVFKLDVTKCPSCGGDMWLKAAVVEKSAIERYLKHVGIDHQPPARAPPRSTWRDESILPPTDSYDEAIICLD